MSRTEIDFFHAESTNLAGKKDGRILTLDSDRGDKRAGTFRYRWVDSGKWNWRQKHYCNALVRGRAPVVVLDSLFVALAEMLGWEIVAPKELEFLRAPEGAFLVHRLKLRDLRWKYGAFDVAALEGGRYTVMFHQCAGLAGFGHDHEFRVALSAKEAVALLEWIAHHAGWEIEDLPEPADEVRTKEAKRSKE